MKETYRELQQEVSKRGFGSCCHNLIEKLFFEAARVLSNSEKQDTVSKVLGKSYFTFARKYKSRPINEALYWEDRDNVAAVLRAILTGRRRTLEAEAITRGIYTVTMTCCAAIDVNSSGDKKTPGTIFEWLCAAIMTAALEVEPCRSLAVLNLDLETKLPTDFIFDLGREKPKFHLPVKTSTRERIIQVWAHQRVLDGVYGVGRFLAMPVILTETKLGSAKNEVVEICLPLQWRLYQMHIASLWNVCYLDAPSAYLSLDRKFPRVAVSTIGDMLAANGRLDELLEAHGLKPK